MLSLKQELDQRGFLHQYSHEELFSRFEQGGQTLYRGVDPTADSMHLGQFVGFMHAVQWMKRGNKLILIVGGATGMIGDPGGKDAERNFLDEATLQHNVAAIAIQMQSILDRLTEMTGDRFDFQVINNLDFYKDMSFLGFLRKVGKYITVNQMMNKETVKKRIEDPEKSISYTEFSYMLLQAYDYLKLYEDYSCTLQIAGSDQWGNCMTGLELIKKRCDGAEVFAATCPLITDSTGKKFGKSEGNALWLDPKKNSPYVIYQYFINTTDDDIEKYFKLLTLTPFETIENIIERHRDAPEKRIGQELLAHAITQSVFGTDAARQAQLITQTLFGASNPVEQIAAMTSDDRQALHHALGKQGVSTGTRIIEAVVLSGLADSNGDAKQAIKNKSIYLNEVLVEDMGYALQEKDFLQGTLVLLRKGKKNYSSIWKN